MVNKRSSVSKFLIHKKYMKKVIFITKKKLSHFCPNYSKFFLWQKVTFQSQLLKITPITFNFLSHFSSNYSKFSLDCHKHQDNGVKQFKIPFFIHVHLRAEAWQITQAHLPNRKKKLCRHSYIGCLHQLTKILSISSAS